jgi:lipid-A-disaccharide synthase
MLIAGEASGDELGAGLARALREELTDRQTVYSQEAQPLLTGLEPRLFGAGGPRMKAAGVDIAFDLTRHSVTGITDVLREYVTFRRLFNQLLELAVNRQPDVVVGIDYGGFNLRFARAIRRRMRRRDSIFNNWNPRLVQFVSPQVWASRAGRAHQMAADHDLLLSIFPFEKAWYARRVPKLRVEFVGHPMVDRMQEWKRAGTRSGGPSRVVLLPGSRARELSRHMPVMLEAFRKMQIQMPDLRGWMVLPTETAAAEARSAGVPGNLTIQAGDLETALADADVAIAKTGTVTLECAFLGVPAVTMYKASWRDYQLARRLVTVKALAMPNLLANEMLFPEFIQDAATPDNLAAAALDLLRNPDRRREIQSRLETIVASLGPPGAAIRAAHAIANLVSEPRRELPASSDPLP